MDTQLQRIEEIEETQEALRASIERTKVLADKTDRLLKEHKRSGVRGHLMGLPLK